MLIKSGKSTERLDQGVAGDSCMEVTRLEQEVGAKASGK